MPLRRRLPSTLGLFAQKDKSPPFLIDLGDLGAIEQEVEALLQQLSRQLAARRKRDLIATDKAGIKPQASHCFSAASTSTGTFSNIVRC